MRGTSPPHIFIDEIYAEERVRPPRGGRKDEGNPAGVSFIRNQTSLALQAKGTSPTHIFIEILFGANRRAL